MVRYRYEMLVFGNYYHENLIIEGLFINIDINGKGFFWCSKIWYKGHYQGVNTKLLIFIVCWKSENLMLEFVPLSFR